MDPFLGQIIMFGGNFAPRGWAYCDGQLLAINQNSALFSILGTTYGGDGRTSFALPDLRGSVPVGPRRGPGLTDRRQGERGGAENTTLTQTQMASHSHSHSVNRQVIDAAATSPVPTGYPAAPMVAGRPVDAYIASEDVDESVDITSTAVGVGQVGPTSTGGSQSHNNMQPYLAVNYIIALEGFYPSRN